MSRTAKLRDLTGNVFGRLTVTRRAMTISICSRWLCMCSCGTETIIAGRHLLDGNTRSCGCFNRETASLTKRKHGRSWVNKKATPEYMAWSSMKHRCLNSKAQNFKRYGGRGISVCTRWIESFKDFLADMGQRPSSAHSLDRIDNDGNYEPGNCRWATFDQQQRNRSNTGIVRYNGKRLTVPELSALSGVPYERLKTRLARGWPVERAIQ